MSDKSKIEWTDATWNPVTGCSKVSEGCRNCYALTFAERFRGTPGHYFEHGFDVTMRPDKLDQPLRWRRPRRIFVNSMSDLFHPEVPITYIHEVFKVMAEANWHTFQVLTKRPDRMVEALKSIQPLFEGMIFNGSKVTWPLPNVWLGVSVENQQAADERIPFLLQTPAAVRFLSCEPLLGPVDLSEWFGLYEPEDGVYALKVGSRWKDSPDWVIVGGESGHKARPLHPEWVRELRDQCQAAGVPFFFKQWGEWKPTHELVSDQYGYVGKKWFNWDPDTSMCRIGKGTAGRELDGRTWDEYPKEATIHE